MIYIMTSCNGALVKSNTMNPQDNKRIAFESNAKNSISKQIYVHIINQKQGNQYLTKIEVRLLRQRILIFQMFTNLYCDCINQCRIYAKFILSNEVHFKCIIFGINKVELLTCRVTGFKMFSSPYFRFNLFNPPVFKLW